MPRQKGDSARDRLNLFLAIVPFVLSRDVTNVQEIAERFGTSPDRVRDAISAIACDGGANEARRNFDTELFNIDWDSYDEDETVILTVANTLRAPAPFASRQKAMFLAGLELLKSHPHYRRLPEFETLLDKLRGEGGGTDVFAVTVDRNTETASLIQDAIDAGVRVRFTYTNNRGERSERTVEPYRQDVENGQRYVKGYCLTRNELRTFNLDSIENVVVTDEPDEPREIDTLSLSGSLFEPHEDDLMVDLVIETSALPLIAPYRQPGDKPVSTGDYSTVSIPFSHPHTAVRMVSVLAGVARVHEPASVRDDVAEFARKALSAYSVSA